MLPALPFIRHCFWQEQGGLSPGKARHCLSCLPRRTRNEKWEEEMKKEETPARECARGDGHIPPHSLSWGKQPSLSAAYHREGYIAMFLRALYVLSLLSHLWRCSADFRGFGDDLEGLSFQCCESAKRKKKIIKFGDSWCYIFQDVPPHEVHFHSLSYF